MKKHSALDFLKKSEWSHESRYFENTLQKDEASQICAHCPNCHKNNIQTAQNREKGLSQEASCSSGCLREGMLCGAMPLRARLAVLWSRGGALVRT